MPDLTAPGRPNLTKFTGGLDAKARRRLQRIERDGYEKLPVCVAKTQYSFSTDPLLRGAPSGHVVNVREVRLAAGAEFVAWRPDESSRFVRQIADDEQVSRSGGQVRAACLRGAATRAFASRRSLKAMVSDAASAAMPRRKMSATCVT